MKKGENMKETLIYWVIYLAIVAAVIVVGILLLKLLLPFIFRATVCFFYWIIKLIIWIIG